MLLGVLVAYITLTECAAIMQVFTDMMKQAYQKKAKAYHMSIAGLFTVLMVACAFCGTCCFRASPTREAPFKLVSPVGAWTM